MSAVVDFIRNGGFMMYPLIICSFALTVIVIERIISLRRASTDGDGLLDAVKSSYGSREQPNPSAAMSVCEKSGGPLGRMFARGIKNAARPADSIEMAMEQEAANEQPALEANLTVLRTIINITPLLGLLGTIAGMIQAFRAAKQTGLSNPNQILGGISEALISTATGITLAVLGFIFYNYFSNQSRRIVEDMEYYGAELVNFLTGRID